MSLVYTKPGSLVITFHVSLMKSILCYISAILLVTLAFCGIQKAFAGTATGRAIVGIDYGTTNVRMGMLRSGVGSVEIVLSFESDRKTINAVAYRDESTLFSQTAMNMVNLHFILIALVYVLLFSSQSFPEPFSVA